MLEGLSLIKLGDLGSPISDYNFRIIESLSKTRNKYFIHKSPIGYKYDFVISVQTMVGGD